MDNQTPARVAAGVPTGGQFAEMDRAEADIDLTNFLIVDGDESVIAKLEPTIEHGIVTIPLPSGGERQIDVDDLPNRPDDYLDPAADLLANGNIRLYYACDDESPFEYEWPEGAQFREFHSEGARDDFIREQESALGDDAEVFIVDHFEHSGSRYTLLGKLGEEIRTQDRWDSRPSCVLVVPAGENGYGDPRLAGQDILREFNDYVSGDVYFVEVVDVLPNGDVEEISTVHGYIGRESTQSIVTSRDY